LKEKFATKWYILHFVFKPIVRNRATKVRIYADEKPTFLKRSLPLKKLKIKVELQLYNSTSTFSSKKRILNVISMRRKSYNSTITNVENSPELFHGLGRNVYLKSWNYYRRLRRYYYSRDI